MDALGSVLGVLERSWGHLGWSSGHLGKVLGPLGNVLGPSWGVLGNSWEVFGKSWRLPGTILEAFWDDFPLLKQFTKIAKNLEKSMVFH